MEKFKFNWADVLEMAILGKEELYDYIHSIENPMYKSNIFKKDYFWKEVLLLDDPYEVLGILARKTVLGEYPRTCLNTNGEFKDMKTRTLWQQMILEIVVEDFRAALDTWGKIEINLTKLKL